MVFRLCNSPHGLFSVSYFIKILSKILEICSGQKCDGRTDGQTEGRTKRRLYALSSGSIKINGKTFKVEGRNTTELQKKVKL